MEEISEEKSEERARKSQRKKKEIKEKLSDWKEKINNGNLSVFLVDECHLLWGDICGYVWGKTSERIEVPMTNEREKQTYYGALNYQTKEFFLKAYDKADSEKTVDFVKYLRAQCPGQRIAIIWDRASYHRYKKMKEYLEEVNGGLPPESWPVTCILLAPNAPEQNPVEDIWLKGKNEVRKNYYLCNSFKEVKDVFVRAIEGKVYDFPKVYQYG